VQFHHSELNAMNLQRERCIHNKVFQARIASKMMFTGDKWPIINPLRKKSMISVYESIILKGRMGVCKSQNQSKTKWFRITRLHGPHCLLGKDVYANHAPLDLIRVLASAFQSPHMLFQRQSWKHLQNQRDSRCHFPWKALQH
jgi:hypothetical protein